MSTKIKVLKENNNVKEGEKIKSMEGKMDERNKERKMKAKKKKKKSKK